MSKKIKIKHTHSPENPNTNLKQLAALFLLEITDDYAPPPPSAVAAQLTPQEQMRAYSCMRVSAPPQSEPVECMR